MVPGRRCNGDPGPAYAAAPIRVADDKVKAPIRHGMPEPPTQASTR